MARFWQLVSRNESGFALIFALICLAVGGIIVAASLGFASTALRARQSMEVNIHGLYAAESGVEDVLWSLINGVSPRTTLPQTSNGNRVSMQVEEIGDLTLYAGEWVTTSNHFNWLLVEGDVVWDDAAGAYKYTVTVTWNAEAPTVILLSEVGAKLPAGYTYQVDSAALFGSNLSTDEPGDELDVDGAHLLKWTLPPPRPSITESNPTKTQMFYIGGAGSLEGHYSWVVAVREDVGAVGELAGTFYIIIATATSLENSEVTSRIEADVMLSGGNGYIISWQIHPN